MNHPDAVIPMEDLPDPMPMYFPFKAANVTGATVYVGVQLITPPAGWATYSEQQCGTLTTGTEDYFLFNTPTRAKPVTNTTESVTLRVTYYNDAYITEINHDDIVYTFTYVNFNDGSYNVVDEDTFEVDLEGWANVNEAGTTSLARSTTRSRTGVASMKHSGISTGEVAYAKKSFTIANLTRAFIRIWAWFLMETTDELVLEIITDAKNVSQKRVVPVPMDATPKCGTEVAQQWVCIAAKLPVNGTYEVRLRARCDYASAAREIYYDDIKVVES